MAFPMKKKKPPSMGAKGDPFAVPDMGPMKKPTKFKEKSAPGNQDFGLIGESAPSPMTATPPRVPRLMGEMGLPKRRKAKKGF